MNLFGTDFDNFFSQLKPWTEVIRRRRCLRKECPLYVDQFTNQSLSMAYTTVSTIDLDAATMTQILEKLNKERKEFHCSECRGNCMERYSFPNDCSPNLLILPISGMMTEKTGSKVIAKEEDLKEITFVKGVEYQLVAYTMYTGSHFYAVILNNGEKVKADGLSVGFKKHKPDENHSVSSIWLAKVE